MRISHFFKVLETCINLDKGSSTRQCKKFLLTLGIGLITFASLISFTANAETVYYIDHERGLKFSLDTSTKEAALGTGDMSVNASALLYPSLDDPAWNTDYWSKWNNLEIPETINYNSETYTVTSVADNAFYKCTYIHTIVLPNAIRTIGLNAFGYCIELTDINFPTELEHISAGAFTLCQKITKINLPSKVNYIGGGAFHDCTAAAEVFIPASCKEIDDEAFNWCTNIEKLTIEDGSEILTMGICQDPGLSYSGTASYCLRGMFGDAKNLKEVHWGRNLELRSNSDGDLFAPFRYTTNFYESSSGAKIVSSRRIKKLTFGEYVTEIPRNAFQKGSIEMPLVLPPNVKEISDYAFNGTFLNGTKTITFPASLESIGEYAFAGPNGVEFNVIVSEAKTPPTITQLPFGSETSTLVLSVPSGYGDTYRNDTFWGKYPILDPMDELTTVNVKTSGSLYGRLLAQGVQIETTRRLKLQGLLNDNDWSTVKQMSNLYDLDLEEIENEEMTKEMLPKSICYIRLPHNLKKLGDETLSERPLMGTLEIPESCTYIGANTARKTLINRLIIPNNGIKIDVAAFSFMPNLEEVNLSNVNIVGERAFYCSSLKKVILGNGCNISGPSTFNGCYSLETIEINGTVKISGESSFNLVDSSSGFPIKDVIFNGCIQDTKGYIFSYPSANYLHRPEIGFSLHIKDLEGYLKSSLIGLGSSFAYFADAVDYNGKPLTSVALPEGITAVSDGHFYNFKDLTHVILASTIKSIGESAFEGCPINELVLPENLEKIGKNAFKHCSKIEEVSIPNSITEINTGAFLNCESLKNVYAYSLEPITLSRTDSWTNDYPFTGVSAECCLHIPIGTATKYRNANWTIPKYRESGILSITVEGNGSVTYNGSTASAGTSQFLFTPYIPFDLIINPNSGSSLKSVVLNGEDITNTITDNNVSFDDPDSNINITVTFTDNYKKGDSNSDNQIDVADAVNIVNHIAGRPTTNFSITASDINEDENISNSDYESTIELIQQQSYNQPSVTNYVENNDDKNGMLSFTEAESNNYTISLKNEANITALQFDMKLNDLNLSDIKMSGALAHSHELRLNNVDASTVRAILISSTTEPLPENQTLISFTPSQKSESPSIGNIFASDDTGKSKTLQLDFNTSGISDINSENVTIFSSNNYIVVVNANSQNIAVYTLNGMRISSQKACNDQVKIDVEKGTYIVMVGGRPFKVMVK